MLVLQLLYHPAKFHHVDGSSSDLCWNEIAFSTVLDKVLPNDTKKLTHVRVALDHLLEALHLVELYKLFFEVSELVKLLVGDFVLLLNLIQLRLRSTSTLWSFLSLDELMSCRSLLLTLLLEFKVVVQLFLKSLHLGSDLNKSVPYLRLSRLFKYKSILLAKIGLVIKNLKTIFGKNWLLVDMRSLLTVLWASEFRIGKFLLIYPIEIVICILGLIDFLVHFNSSGPRHI